MVAGYEVYTTNMHVQNTDEEPIYVDHYNPDALHKILETKHRTTQRIKNKETMLFQMLNIIDDFADDTAFARPSQAYALYLRRSSLHQHYRCNSEV